MINLKKMQIQPIEVANAIQPIMVFANQQHQRIEQFSTKLVATTKPSAAHSSSPATREKVMWKFWKFARSLAEKSVLEYSKEDSVSELFKLVEDITGKSDPERIFVKAAEEMAETTQKIRDVWSSLLKMYTQDPRAIEFQELINRKKNKRHTDRILSDISQLARETEHFTDSLAEMTVSLQALCYASLELAYWLQSHKDATVEEMADRFVESYELNLESIELNRRIKSKPQPEISLADFKRKMVQ